MASLTGCIRVGILVFFRQIDFEDAGRGSKWCQHMRIGSSGIECSGYAVVVG
jgi:hypothetical protein